MTDTRSPIPPSQTLKKATRDGFGETLVELAKNDTKIVALTADLTSSVRMQAFAETFPDRFFTVGIAEQNMIGIAAGLAMSGFTPFATTYGVFMGRAWDQIRVSVCLNNLNVKLIGTHAGVSVGADGGTAQALEDIAMLRALPNLTIVCPADYEEAKKVVHAAAQMRGPVYIRLSREESPILTQSHMPFEIGKAQILRQGQDVTIIGCGPLLDEALRAAAFLEKEGISAEVINCHTIKPIDRDTLVASAHKTRCVVTVENHQIRGGLGGAVAETLAQHFPVPIEMVGVHDSFGQSGTAEELLTAYELTAPFIMKAIERVTKRKHSSLFPAVDEPHRWS
ncbi:MAG: hypothetical protein A2804_00810 [Candidatus Pacebacteria bacterium RIFCSPHIGHO2_01_FULL_46_10]|nr:MAG: hypothetical protein A2804_00810 [Candidatus Pacebacteria bacterium RIFCSPHIGHO2_01_FULL_46_10]